LQSRGQSDRGIFYFKNWLFDLLANNFSNYVKNQIMKNPFTKKFGSNSDERESFFPNFDAENPSIVGEPICKNINLDSKNRGKNAN